MTIDPKDAGAAALSDIDDVVRRVRQSRVYRLASLLLILWGALTFFAGYVAFLFPGRAMRVMPGSRWTSRGSPARVAISAIGYARAGRPHRRCHVMFAAFVLFFAFGFLRTSGPSALHAASPRRVLADLFHAGLPALSAYGSGSRSWRSALASLALTLVGYFFVGPWFELWMAVVNGGGLVLGGLWMRRS